MCDQTSGIMVALSHKWNKSAIGQASTNNTMFHFKGAQAVHVARVLMKELKGSLAVSDEPIIPSIMQRNLI